MTLMLCKRMPVVLFAGHAGKSTNLKSYEGEAEGHQDHYLNERLGKESALFDGRPAIAHNVKTWSEAGADVIVLGPQRLEDDLKKTRGRWKHVLDEGELQSIGGKLLFTGEVGEEYPDMLVTVGTNDMIQSRVDVRSYLKDLDTYARLGKRHVSSMVRAQDIVEHGCGFRQSLNSKRFYNLNHNGSRTIVAFPNAVSYIPAEVDLQKVASLADLVFPNREKGTKPELVREVWNDVRYNASKRLFFWQMAKELSPLIGSMARSRFGRGLPGLFLPEFSNVVEQLSPVFRTYAPERSATPVTPYVSFAMDFDDKSEARAVAQYHGMELTHRK